MHELPTVKPLQHRTNILIFVDVSKALSEKTLEGHCYFMDNGPFKSEHQATTQLRTRCAPGQLLFWKVLGLDVQTPAAILDISFLDADGKVIPRQEATPDHEVRPEQNSWTGVVPPYMVHNQPYFYRIEIQMGRGANSVLALESPSIICINPMTERNSL